MVLIVGILILSFVIFQALRFSNEAYYIGLSLIVFNPYIFRLYLAFPGMVTDMVFVFGLSLMCLALLKIRDVYLMLGSFIMIISRQTALLTLPGIICWLLFSNSWKWMALKKRALILATLLCLNVIIYLLESHVAEGFSGKSLNIDHVVGILCWFSNHFNAQTLFIFFIQGIIPYLMIIALIIGFGKVIAWKTIDYKQLSLWLLFPLFICAQPYLAGPGITGGNITRLQAIAFIPLIIGIICELDKQKVFRTVSKRAIFVVICLESLASFHHLFVGFGTFKSFTLLFLIVQSIIALLVAAVLYLSAEMPNQKGGHNLSGRS